MFANDTVAKKKGASVTADMTDAELDAVLRRAGLTLEPGQRAALLGVLPRFEAMLKRVRTPRDRSAEPAHVFVPGQR